MVVVVVVVVGGVLNSEGSGGVVSVFEVVVGW